MPYSSQTVTSDGTLETVDIIFEYIDRSEIHVYFDSIEQFTGWAWVGTEKRIQFSPVVPNGIVVLIRRTTDLSKLRHEYSAGAAFRADTLDESLEQVLHIAQEATEAQLGGDYYADINMHNNSIVNLKNPETDPTAAVSLKQYQDDALGAHSAKSLAENAAGNAMISAGAALTSRNQAEGFKETASTAAGTATTQAGFATAAKNLAVDAKNDAETARDKAQEWAEKSTEVAPGEFSAKYWATDAASSAVLAGDNARLDIGTVTTGAAGSTASATITGTVGNQSLNLTIPRGDKGDVGTGDVTGPDSTVNDSIALFNGVTGKLIKAGPTISSISTYTASGAGAVTRPMRDKLSDVVSVKDFGAIGDGITDDTAAIQAALNTSAAQIIFPDGVYRVVDAALNGTPVLVSNQSGRIIKGSGVITATTTVLRVLGIYGEHTSVQISVHGNNCIAEAIRIYADNCTVANCYISDLYTTTYSCVAIGTTNVNGSTFIRNNDIRNLTSVGDGVLGNGNGMARGIAISMSTDTSGVTIIENNTIINVLGEEGDSVAILSSNGSGTYYTANVIVRNNIITNFTRRAIKIQASGVKVQSNILTHNFTDSAVIPNRLAVIDLVQGGDHLVTGNVLDKCKWFTQISCSTNTPDSFNNFNISDNTITGIGEETSNNVITLTTQGSNVQIRNNYIEGGTAQVISVSATNGVVIHANVIYTADNPLAAVIRTTASAVDVVITANILLRGARQAFISNDSPNCVIANNHLKCNSSLFRNSAGGSNSVVSGNSIDGTSFVYSGTGSLVGNRFGGNYYLRDQAILVPDILFNAQNTHPSIQFSGLSIQRGQIVFNTYPTPGSYVGWVSSTAGDGSEVEWHQFGLIPEL